MSVLTAGALGGVPADADAGEGGCFHCGQALPTAAHEACVEGQRRRYCCAGCAAATAWIDDAGLSAYYRLRTLGGSRVEADAADFDAWDHEQIMARHARDTAAGREIVIATDGMHCAACAWLIDRALAREAGVFEVCANAVTGRIRIEWNPRQCRLSALLARLASLGYRPYLAGSAAGEQTRRREFMRWVLRVGIAGIVTMQTMMFAEALYLDTAGQMPPATRDFFRWLAFLLSTPVVFYAGFPFLAGAWHELRQRTAGMDTLVAISVLLAWSGSTIETLRGGAQVWFDAAVMFVFLLLVARLFEFRARQLASARVEALARARPVLAVRERAAGTEQVPLEQLRPGDVVRVAAGQHIPADGVLLDRCAALDESLLTGESRPVTRQAGDPVLAGSVGSDHMLRLRVTAAGSATRLAALERLTQRAQEHKPLVAQQAQRIAAGFVLGILMLAAAVYACWHVLAPARAFEVTLALLVVSCPCALSLAVPAALASAYSALSRLGVLVLRADALQKLAAVDTVVFDKTGTLGEGTWRIGGIQLFGGVKRATALRDAAALERDSRHPLATAFHAHDDGAEARDVTLHAGQGVEGTVEGRRLRLGAAGYAVGRDDDGAVWLGDGTVPLARFALLETPRVDAASTLRQLDALGLRLQVLSGDAVGAVRRFARRLGVGFERVAGRLSPAGKLARVRELQGTGRVVAMVGDGINDAPVLGGADVSIAIGSGADLARQSADLVLLHPALSRVTDAMRLAIRTRRVIRQNLAWAIGYNLVALPLAALGHVQPWMAALAMVLSSLTVTLNALRLTREAT